MWCGEAGAAFWQLALTCGSNWLSGASKDQPWRRQWERNRGHCASPPSSRTPMRWRRSAHLGPTGGWAHAAWRSAVQLPCQQVSNSSIVMADRNSVSVDTLLAQASTFGLASGELAFLNSEMTLVSSKCIRSGRQACTDRRLSGLARSQCLPRSAWPANQRCLLDFRHPSAVLSLRQGIYIYAHGRSE